MNGWYALVAFLCAFVVAQLWKFVAGLLSGTRGESRMVGFRQAIDYLSRSGGMPSGHAASMTALSVYLGCAYGFDSGIFALAIATSVIVVYDAIHVRYAVGEQGKALNGLLKTAGKAGLPVVEGHTPIQALVGILVGAAVGWIVFMLAK